MDGDARLRRRAQRGAALTTAAFLLACDSPTVPGESAAYDPTALTAGALYHWPLGATIAVYVDTTGTGAAAVDLRAAVTRGFALWQGVLRYREFALRLSDRADDADVVVALRGAPSPVQLDLCDGAIGDAAGFTLLCPAGDSARTLPLRSGAAGRVKIAIVVDGEAAATRAAFDALVAHEVGHALGIGGHSMNAADLMFAEPRVGAPSARDASTLRYVLHRPPTLRL